jgi:3-oxoacyl-[acyl-carrier protein] reductase
VVLITGAGRGIGRAAAQAFASAGYAVVLAERRPVLGRRVAAALRRAGATAHVVPTDVARPASVRRAVDAALGRFGRLDCLVNNAGVLAVGPLATLPVADLWRMVSVNLAGPLLAARAVLPVMLRQRSGSIVTVASQLGKTGAADYVAYCATKWGVLGMTRALAAELAGTGVRTWAVCPGLVDTAMARLAGVTARERAGLIRPERVARAILDLATGRRGLRSGGAVDVLR